MTVNNMLRTSCPTRFSQGGVIPRWVGEIVLGHSVPSIIPEVGFLDPPLLEDGSPLSDREVGKIDNILLIPGTQPLQWCALELQSVYFSGEAMRNEFDLIGTDPNDELPFPAASHRPDNRSSGPKRLMPQLQTKVPSLRRWGKKMAVVIDRGFFSSLAMGNMRTVKHVSNCDVAWFVVRFDEAENGHYDLVPDSLYLTTLEDSVEGLTAGVPTSLDVFEKRILEKMEGLPRPSEIASDQ